VELSRQTNYLSVTTPTAKCTEVVEGTGGPLDALVTEQMDVEQIWGQVELQNSSLVPFFEERLQVRLL
jgi:hypothetical protein